MADSGSLPTAPLIYRCSNCRAVARRNVPFRENLGRRYYRWADGDWHQNIEALGCDCGSYMARLGEVRATFDKNVACTGSCQNAAGADCRCSCGGRNHGLAYLRVGLQNQKSLPNI